jgi:Zn-dependent M16 (insulinase) family peptidase
VQVRGLGLAYGFSMYGDAEEGLVYFSLARSTNLPRAYAEARAIVRAFVAGERPVDPVALENAAAAVISGVVSREQTVSACGLQSLMSALRGTGPGHNARLLRAVRAVTAGDVRRVLERYLGRLFEPAAANMCITAAAGKADEVAAGFEALGWAVRRETADEAVADAAGGGGGDGDDSEGGGDAG